MTIYYQRDKNNEKNKKRSTTFVRDGLLFIFFFLFTLPVVYDRHTVVCAIIQLYILSVAGNMKMAKRHSKMTKFFFPEKKKNAERENAEQLVAAAGHGHDWRSPKKGISGENNNNRE